MNAVKLLQTFSNFDLFIELSKAGIMKQRRTFSLSEQKIGSQITLKQNNR